MALPITRGTVRFPGIKIHDPRMIRLMEVLLHAGTRVAGWSAKQIHESVLATLQLTPKHYGLNQLRYDLRKMKAHGLIERDHQKYAYGLAAKGVQVSLLFANRRFHHKPDESAKPDSKLESAYYRADAAIQQIVDLLAAA